MHSQRLAVNLSSSRGFEPLLSVEERERERESGQRAQKIEFELVLELRVHSLGQAGGTCKGCLCVCVCVCSANCKRGCFTVQEISKFNRIS